MLKKTFAFMLAVILIVSFTACGKKQSADSIPGAQDYHGEGEIQGGIKSDEELAKITEEADTWDGQEDEEPTSEPSFEDNTGHEPESYGSGNPQDYWQSDSYFDLVGYLYANGADNVYMVDRNGQKTESDPLCYMAFFNGCTWRIQIGLDTGNMLWYFKGGTTGTNPAYAVTPTDVERMNSPEKHTMITVDKIGTTVPDYNIETLAVIVEAIKANPDSIDPLNGYDSIYYSNYN